MVRATVAPAGGAPVELPKPLILATVIVESPATLTPVFTLVGLADTVKSWMTKNVFTVCESVVPWSVAVVVMT
jgi:hypothetical protein